MQRKVTSESEVAQSCSTVLDPMDCSPSGSSLHGIFQARILELVAISFSKRSSQPRDWTPVSRTVGRHFTVWATFPGGGPLQRACVQSLVRELRSLMQQLRPDTVKQIFFLQPLLCLRRSKCNFLYVVNQWHYCDTDISVSVVSSD